MMKQLTMDGPRTMPLKNEAANIHLESTQHLSYKRQGCNIKYTGSLHAREYQMY